MILKKNLLLWGVIPAAIAIFCGVAACFWCEESVAFLKTVSPGCLFRRFLGIKCLGCGGTRAAIALCEGRVIDAFRYNLWWIPSIIIVLEECFYYAFGGASTLENFPKLRKARQVLLFGYLGFSILFFVGRNIWDF